MSVIDEWESDRPDPPPPAVPPPAAATDPPPLKFPTPQAFVAWWATVYRRDVVDDRDLRWCPDWWRHEEASILLVDLWRTFEQLRHDKAGGMSTLWRDHAGHIMRTLMDPKGPLKKCSADKGHNHYGEIAPLPVTDPPEGWWIPEDSTPPPPT